MIIFTIGDEAISKILSTTKVRGNEVDVTKFRDDLTNFIQNHLLLKDMKAKAKDRAPVTENILQQRALRKARIRDACKELLALLDDEQRDESTTLYDRHAMLSNRETKKGLYVSIQMPGIMELKYGLSEFIKLTEPLKIDRRKKSEAKPSDTDLFVIGAAEVYKDHIGAPAASESGPFARFCCTVAQELIYWQLSGDSVRDSMERWRDAEKNGTWAKRQSGKQRNKTPRAKSP